MSWKWGDKRVSWDAEVLLRELQREELHHNTHVHQILKEGLGFRVQHLKSEHSLVKQLVKCWNKTPPTQETHNIEKI